MENRMHLSDKDKYEVNLLWNTFYLMRDHFKYDLYELTAVTLFASIGMVTSLCGLGLIWKHRSK